MLLTLSYQELRVGIRCLVWSGCEKISQNVWSYPRWEVFITNHKLFQLTLWELHSLGDPKPCWGVQCTNLYLVGCWSWNARNVCHVSFHVPPKLVVYHSSWIFLWIHAMKDDWKYNKRCEVELRPELPGGQWCLYFQVLLHSLEWMERNCQRNLHKALCFGLSLLGQYIWQKGHSWFSFNPFVKSMHCSQKNRMQNEHPCNCPLFLQVQHH